MNIFDGHFHIETGLEKYNITTRNKNVIFNSFDSYDKYLSHVAPSDSVTVIFDYANNLARVADILRHNKVNGLKIHSRIQKITENDYSILAERLQELKTALPIIVDAFYFGDEYEYRPSLKHIIAIAKKFPDNPIIVAHSGGIHVLEYFYHLKTLDNLFFDLSLSLAYLKNTSVFIDFKNLIRYGNHSKVLFGTDYPFIDPALQLQTFIDLASELKLSSDAIDNILFLNAAGLFKKSS